MQSIGSLLPHFLQEISSNTELTLIFLQQLWPRVVGDELAHKTAPLSLKKKTLVLAVPGEAWKQQLSEMRGMLIRSVNTFWDMKLLNRIEFQIHLKERTEGGDNAWPAVGPEKGRG